MHLPRRALLPVAAAAASVVLAGTPAHAAPLTPFAADSGDSCRYGATEGTLDWKYDGPVADPSVQVTGVLTDSAGASPCWPDALLSTATFTAYGSQSITPVDTESVKADNETVRLDFALSDDAGVRRIERVVVQVCRQTSGGFGYCGEAKEYRMP